MTKEGDKSYEYGWLDKVTAVSEGGRVTARFGYGIDNQMAYVNRFGSDGQLDQKRSESLFWDGLALVRRNGTNLLNEPYPTGGNPVVAYGSINDKNPSADAVLFNDILGSTIGVMNKNEFKTTGQTLFGERNVAQGAAKAEGNSIAQADAKNDLEGSESFFTGKPEIKETGYAFLFRNYRSCFGKWQSADPAGYPDGWNQSAYCNSNAASCVDNEGLDINDLVESYVRAKVVTQLNSVFKDDFTTNFYLFNTPSNIDTTIDISSVTLKNVNVTFTCNIASESGAKTGNDTNFVFDSSTSATVNNYTITRSNATYYNKYKSTSTNSLNGTTGSWSRAWSGLEKIFVNSVTMPYLGVQYTISNLVIQINGASYVINKGTITKRTYVHSTSE